MSVQMWYISYKSVAFQGAGMTSEGCRMPQRSSAGLREAQRTQEGLERVGGLKMGLRVGTYSGS